MLAATAIALASSSEGEDTPKSTTTEPNSLVHATLLRNSDSRFNLIFKHDSESNGVRIQSVGTSDVADGRAAICEDDLVMRINGVRTVC